MLISQIRNGDGGIHVVAREGTEAYVVRDATSVFDLAQEAIHSKIDMSDIIGAKGFGQAVDLEEAYLNGLFLPPILHPDPHHFYVSVHSAVSNKSIVSGFGDTLIPTENPMGLPKLIGCLGKGPRIAEIYVVDPANAPFFVGVAMASQLALRGQSNADRQNISTGRVMATTVGLEILVGRTPSNFSASLQLKRHENIIWQRIFANEKIRTFRNEGADALSVLPKEVESVAGDIHLILYAPAEDTQSITPQVEEGDIFEIITSDFGMSLHNRLMIS